MSSPRSVVLCWWTSELVGWNPLREPLQRVHAAEQGPRFSTFCSSCCRAGPSNSAARRSTSAKRDSYPCAYRKDSIAARSSSRLYLMRSCRRRSRSSASHSRRRASRSWRLDFRLPLTLRNVLCKAGRLLLERSDDLADFPRQNTGLRLAPLPFPGSAPFRETAMTAHRATSGNQLHRAGQSGNCDFANLLNLLNKMTLPGFEPEFVP